MIWDRLKKRESVVVETHPANFARIKKAVIKEKDGDNAFKFINEDDPVRLCITIDRAARTITFKLKQRFGIEGIVKP